MLVEYLANFVELINKLDLPKNVILEQNLFVCMGLTVLETVPWKPEKYVFHLYQSLKELLRTFSGSQVVGTLPSNAVGGTPSQ